VVGDQTIKGSESGTSFRQALYFKEIGFNLHDTMIYRKNALSFPDFNRYYQCFEYMFILSKGKPKTANLINDRINRCANDKVSGNYRNTDGTLKPMSGKIKGNKVKEKGIRWNIWEYDVGWGKSYTEKYLKGHPAIFPEQLAHDHIISWSNENDIVLDCFMGSGTTGKMAKLLNRNFIGIEISEEYFNIAKERIESNI
jgi:DNA modification methylase